MKAIGKLILIATIVSGVLNGPVFLGTVVDLLKHHTSATGTC